MRHRAYLRKLSGLNKWVTVLAEVDGPHRSVCFAFSDNAFHHAIIQATHYARLFDELRGIFPDGDGTPTIETLPWHCLWCGEPLPDGITSGRLTCRRSHQVRYRRSYRQREYHPELCDRPKKRKFVHRGTAIYVARQLNPDEGDCYECACGTFHLTRKDGILAAIEQCNQPPKRNKPQPECSSENAEANL